MKSDLIILEYLGILKYETDGWAAPRPAVGSTAQRLARLAEAAGKVSECITRTLSNCEPNPSWLTALLITLDWLALRLKPLCSSLAQVFGWKTPGKARFGWELSISYGKVVRWRRKGKKNKSHERRPRPSQMWQPSWKIMNRTYFADLKLETPWAGEVRIGPQWLNYGCWHKYLTL